MRWRGVVLVVALIVAGCSRPVPKPPTQPSDPGGVYNVQPPALHYEPTDLEQAKTVAYVGMRVGGAKRLSSTPLWGDRNPEQVAHLLAMLRRAEVVATAGPERELEGRQDWHLVVHFTDGTEAWAGYAWQRDPAGGLSWGPPYHFLVSGKGEVRSAELDQLLRGGQWRALMAPAVGLALTPNETVPGGEITVTGAGWVEGKTAHISLVNGGAPVELGEASVERGELRWTGRLPLVTSTDPIGTVGIRVEVPGVGETVTPVKVRLDRR